MDMKKLVIIAIMLLTALSASDLFAAGQAPADRKQWMSEMRQYKRNYFTKELELTREQQTKFYPLYEDMQDQIDKVNDDARAMEKRVADMKDPSDLEYEKATEAMYDAGVRSAEIEREYMDKFRSILTRKQLFRLKAVERTFSREIMKQHHRLRSKSK